MGKSYTESGRIVARISQNGTPWTGSVYRIKLGDKVSESGLSPAEIRNRLTSYETKPSLICDDSVCKKAVKEFRGYISQMPLPDGMR